ncbi:hypothetical protein FRC06_003936 [Ceratobasidium sp. 370]|nr:hypothetical protein FRC06_003936 [Ceratobasidium sp. 370]
MFPSLIVSVFLAASTLVQASPLEPRGGKSGGKDSFISGFLNKLKQLGLTTSENLWEETIHSSGGGYLVDLLKSQIVTVLIPKNDAADPDHYSSDDPLDLLSYSIVFGSPEDDFKITNSSLESLGSHTRRGAKQSRSGASSGLKWPSGSRKRWNGLLDNNQVQIIDQFASTSKKRWNDDPLIIIDRPVHSATVVSRSTFKNIVILVIDTFLTLPRMVSDLLCKPLVSGASFTKFGGALQKAGLLDTVDYGFKSTVFAPTDEAFYDADLSDDDIASVLKNHFFFGKVVYSPLFPQIPKATAASGKELDLIYQDGVHYVQCGSTKAVILRSDVTSKWGVVHVIDKVLKCY